MYLLPVPRELVYQDGICELPYDCSIVIDLSCDLQVYETALLLKTSIEEDAGVGCTVERGVRTGTVILSETQDLTPCQYRVHISGRGIQISGGGSQGILYGVQTLRQILRQSGAAIPCMTITDWPDYAVRGFYHDAARGRVPNMSWLRQLVDILSFYKINQLQLYIEHSYLFSGLSEMWRDDTPLTAEDIMELDRYCMLRGIELVPSLATFGHLYKLLSTRQYRGHCELGDAGTSEFSFIDRMEHHTVDVCDQDAMEVICGMIGEFLPLFSSRKFNLCADETFDLGKGKNKKLAQKKGTDRLYMDYIKKLCRFVVQKGSTPMIWGDILLGFPQLASELPEETICLNWGYAPNQSEDSTRIYAEAGVHQYVCPGVSGWNQFVNLQRASYENISRMSSYGLTYGCEGMLNTDWGDFGHVNHPLFSIPGMIYGAAAAWNRQALPKYEEINRRISVLEYRDASGKFACITGELSEQECFGWRDAVFLKERWSKAGETTVRTELGKLKDRLEAQPEKDKRIRSCVRELKECTGAMDAGSRQRIYPYLVAADGIRIFNRIGKILLDAFHNGQKAYETAEELETWYYHYRRLWRTTSRESELYRVGEVINWYADCLRDLS